MPPTREHRMGWNDHMDDDNELGNLPPEAFSPWYGRWSRSGSSKFYRLIWVPPVSRNWRPGIPPALTIRPETAHRHLDDSPETHM